MANPICNQKEKYVRIDKAWKFEKFKHLKCIFHPKNIIVSSFATPIEMP